MRIIKEFMLLSLVVTSTTYAKSSISINNTKSDPYNEKSFTIKACNYLPVEDGVVRFGLVSMGTWHKIKVYTRDLSVANGKCNLLLFGVDASALDDRREGVTLTVITKYTQQEYRLGNLKHWREWHQEPKKMTVIDIRYGNQNDPKKVLIQSNKPSVDSLDKDGEYQNANGGINPDYAICVGETETCHNNNDITIPES